MAAADMVGASAPLGFFDPLGLAKCSEETLNTYREAELKHGRTAMLAVVGFLTQVKELRKSYMKAEVRKISKLKKGFGHVSRILAS